VKKKEDKGKKGEKIDPPFFRKNRPTMPTHKDDGIKQRYIIINSRLSIYSIRLGLPQPRAA
jgi:hypothetical protein